MNGKAIKPDVSEALDLHLGTAGLRVGQLLYVSQGRRELSQFVYDETWLAHPDRFEISPDLPLQSGYQTRRAPRAVDSVFHFALADTEPDAWGRRVIDRAHAKLRRTQPDLRPLNELDYLCAVDDFSRVGALAGICGPKRMAGGPRRHSSNSSGSPMPPVQSRKAPTRPRI